MDSSESSSNKESAQQKLATLVKRISSIAGATQKGLSYFLCVGGLATVYLVWASYSAESELWWNVLKGVLLIWPVAILLFVWSVLGQLSEVPESVAKLNQDTRTAYAGIKEVKIREPKGLRGMFSVLNTFRREDSLSVIFDTVGGISLLVNPFFLFVISLSSVFVVLFTLTAPLVAIF